MKAFEGSKGSRRHGAPQAVRSLRTPLAHVVYFLRTFTLSRFCTSSETPFGGKLPSVTLYRLGALKTKTIVKQEWRSD